MNRGMGFPLSRSQFEYVHIVLSTNNELKEHLDFKNDHHVDYDVCIVYTSFITITTIECCLSIIMTTRTTVGAALHKARLNNC